MFEHKIMVGLSTIYKKEGSLLETLSSSGTTGTLNHLLTTPQIIEVIIEASYSMLDHLLPDGYVTVGKYMELSHEQPTLTLVGGTISAILTVTKIEGNKIYLDVECHDDIGLICKGTYERAIVNRDSLMETAYKRFQNKM
ncbi:MAG: thioesterase family protein [Sedimentibacter sp.]